MSKNIKTIYVPNIIKNNFSFISRIFLAAMLPVGTLNTMTCGSFHGEVIELGTQLIHIYTYLENLIYCRLHFYMIYFILFFLVHLTQTHLIYCNSA